MIEHDRELERYAQVQQELRVSQRKLIARSQFVPQTMRDQLVHEILPLLLNACIATILSVSVISLLFALIVLV